MGRFSAYPRRAYKRRFVAWVQRNLKLVALFVVGLAALVAVETIVVLAFIPSSGFKWWLLGALQTSIVAVGLHLLNAAFLALDREALWQLRGAWGEEATRDELQRAKRKRLIWGWVDSINLQAGDIDHLVVTRNGGLVAIDSKWRNQASDTSDMAREAAKARLRAEALTASLLRSERASHRAKGNAARVTPLVVLWGAAHHDVPEGAQIDGIEFVGGRRLCAWLAQVSGDPVDERAAVDAIRRLEEFRAGAWGDTRTSPSK